MVVEDQLSRDIGSTAGFDWLSLLMISTAKRPLRVSIPWRSTSWTCARMKPSASPNAAKWPVRGADMADPYRVAGSGAPTVEEERQTKADGRRAKQSTACRRVRGIRLCAGYWHCG